MSQDEVEGFANWYEKYPRKVARRDAVKAYRREIKTEEDRLLALMNLELWKAVWTDMQFIPYPATFLNRGQWQEKPPEQEHCERLTPSQREVRRELYAGAGPQLTEAARQRLFERNRLRALPKP